MGLFTALILATPVFGFALTPPAGPPVNPSGPMVVLDSPFPAANALPTRAPSRNAQDAEDDLGDDVVDEAADDEGDLAEDEVEEIEVDLSVDEEGVDEEGEAGSGRGGDMRDYAAAMSRRSDLIGIHKPLGIITWAAMGLTLLTGGIQFHNLYGTWSSLEDTPCVQGSAIFGQGQCSGTPFIHLSLAMTTAALYTATFVVSALMPDPDGELDEGDSDYASNLRTHKILRWVHFGGMLAQLALGIIIANSESFGLDRANDYGTLQALSTVHLAAGFVTFGAMTWAGALFTL
jgi:hypothetical protein